MHVSAPTASAILSIRYKYHWSYHAANDKYPMDYIEVNSSGSYTGKDNAGSTHTWKHSITGTSLSVESDYTAASGYGPYTIGLEGSMVVKFSDGSTSTQNFDTSLPAQRKANPLTVTATDKASVSVWENE